jgi:nucleoside-diphosphate-sugar epimerase
VAQVLVTGGAGFIGSNLVLALLKRGNVVRVLDNLSTGKQENLTDLDIDLVVGDIRDPEIVRKAVHGVDIIFHLAAFISVPASIEDPLVCYEINLMSSINLLWAAYQAGVKRVVLASSSAVYGETEDVVDEASPCQPLSPYAGSKLAMEQVARLFTASYELPTISLRLFNVYGPRQSPDSQYAAAIPLFIQALHSGQSPTIHGDGKQTRDFVFVEDVVRAHLLAAERDDAIGGVFNIGGGKSVSILELVQPLQRIIADGPPPVFGPPRPGDIRFSKADLSLAERSLGYRPMIDLEEGLQITVQWFLEQ